MCKIIKKGVALLAISLLSVFFIFKVQATSAIGNKYVVSAIAGNNGSISPSTVQTVDSGASVTFTAKPNANYMVYQWKVDGRVVQTGGISFTLNNIIANRNVVVSFIQKNLLYAAGANSYLYYSINNGESWHTTPTKPNDRNAIGGVFATNSTVYVVTTSKYMFYSQDNGTSWQSSIATPDYGGIASIFVTPSNTIYIGTKKGHIFYSKNQGKNWTAIAKAPSLGNTVKSIYVTNDAIYAGSLDGNVYYSTDGASWTAINGSPDGSAIRSVYVANNALHVNTANSYVYTSTNLTGGGGWVLYAQTVYSLFVNADGSVIDVATHDGYVYSLSTGDELGFISYTPINSLFLLG